MKIFEKQQEFFDNFVVLFKGVFKYFLVGSSCRMSR